MMDERRRHLLRPSEAVVCITGASRGLGAALVRAAFAVGVKKIYAGYRSEEAVPPFETMANMVRLDVDDPASVHSAAARCGDVNLLINNAGRLERGPIVEADAIDKARAEMETNFFGPLRVCQAFIPHLRRQKNSGIINILSVLSWVTSESFGTYAASKAAAWSLTNSLRAELESDAVHVMGVHTGYIDTDMVSDIQAEKLNPERLAFQILMAFFGGESEFLGDEFSRKTKAALAKPHASIPWTRRMPAIFGVDT